MTGLATCICCNGASIRRSSGQKKRAAPIRHGRYIALTWRPPMPSTARRNAAATELAEARRLTPDTRYSSIAYLTAAEYFGVPKIRSLVETTYLAGLRKAGVPEE
jgi:hypothetical protein